MACPCSKKRRPMAGRPVKAAPDSPSAGARKAVTASAVPTGQWATSCDPTPIRSLIRAQRAARACGGRVVPA